MAGPPSDPLSPRPTDNAVFRADSWAARRADLCRRAVLHAPPLSPRSHRRRRRRSGAFPSMPPSPTGRARASGRRRSAAPRRSSTTIRNIRSGATCSSTGRRRLWRLPARLRPPCRDPGRDRGARRAKILEAGAFLLSLGGDHFVTWPLLKAHAAMHGPLALVQFDAHQDTWLDDGEPHRPRLLRRPRRAGRHDRSRPLDPDRHPHPCARGFRHRDPLRRRGRGDRRGATSADAIIERVGGAQGLSHLRHRLPRPGLCARHRHAGRGRAVLARKACRCCASSASSTSSAPTSSRWRRPMTTPTSPRSRARPCCSIIWG